MARKTTANVKTRDELLNATGIYLVTYKEEKGLRTMCSDIDVSISTLYSMFGSRTILESIATKELVEDKLSHAGIENLDQLVTFLRSLAIKSPLLFKAIYPDKKTIEDYKICRPYVDPIEESAVPLFENQILEYTSLTPSESRSGFFKLFAFLLGALNLGKIEDVSTSEAADMFVRILEAE